MPEATRGFAVLRGGVAEAAQVAAEAERRGYQSAWSPEFYTRSGIVTLAAMSQATTQARIGSAIAYAVGRTPLVLATEARSLDELSGGRPMVICSVSEDEEQARQEAAAQLAFYTAPRTYDTVVEAAGFAAAGEKIRAAFAGRDIPAMIAAVPDEMVDAMTAAGTSKQVQAKLAEFGRHVDHVIVYPVSFGLSEERSRQVTTDLVAAGAP